MEVGEHHAAVVWEELDALTNAVHLDRVRAAPKHTHTLTLTNKKKLFV